MSVSLRERSSLNHGCAEVLQCVWPSVDSAVASPLLTMPLPWLPDVPVGGAGTLRSLSQWMPGVQVGWEGTHDVCAPGTALGHLPCQKDKMQSVNKGFNGHD